MSSKSRVAQEKLAELERGSAPFEDQLREAGRFVGIDLEDTGRSITQTLSSEEEAGDSVYHGREEWLLIWLLKKLQSPKDDIPRITPNSWILLSHLLRSLPLPSTARLLNERKFMGILRQTLERAQKLANDEAPALATSISGIGGVPAKTSKKRKRSGERVEPANASWDQGPQALPTAIFAALHRLFRFTKTTSDTPEGARTAAFSAEYLKSVIRVPAEEAAKILGSWLAVCGSTTLKSQETAHMKIWLAPFVQLWEFRTPGPEDLGQFSLYCSEPLLVLLKATKAKKALPDWTEQLEQLVARNIMIPSKAERTETAGSVLLEMLTRISVIQDSANAPLLFEIAIRSAQAHGLQRRRANDAWFQHVLTTLKAAMPPQRVEQNGKAIRNMLKLAIKYKIDIGLVSLRSVASDYCLAERETNWGLLSNIITLDANVFLIPNEEKELLQELLTRITAIGLDQAWSDVSLQVVPDVLIPLMNGFAKARDLSAFVHHWFTQLVEAERLRIEARLFKLSSFNAWEDETLQTGFARLMEASLTVPQITQLLDWLLAQVEENPDAVCVILDAITISISQEEVVDVVMSRLFGIMFDNAAFKRLGDRYKWRSWRILSRSLGWMNTPALEAIAENWEDISLPFKSLSDQVSTLSINGLLDGSNGNLVDLETYEVFRLTCALWSASKNCTILATVCKPSVIGVLEALAHDIKLLPADLRSDRDLGEEVCDATPNSMYRGVGWMLWSCVRCVLVENPTMLELSFSNKTQKEPFKSLMQTIFWVASVSPDQPEFENLNPWLQKNPEAFADTWASFLTQDEIVDLKELRSLILDTMISSETNTGNPLVKYPKFNIFAARCLDQLRQDIFSRHERERILKEWPPSTNSSSESSSEGSNQRFVLNPAILSLKAKIMQRAAVYEGMKYQDLSDMAEDLSTANLPHLTQSLVSFKELVRQTMSHVTADLKNTRNSEYASDALRHLQKKTKIKSDGKKPHKLSYGLVELFDVLLESFAAKEVQLDDLSIISSSDLTSLKGNFKQCLLVQLEELLTKAKSSKAEKQAERSLTVISTIDSLQKQNFNAAEVTSVVKAAHSFVATLDEADADLCQRVKAFATRCSLSDSAKADGNTSTVYGRAALKGMVQAMVAGKTQHEKLNLLKVTMEDRAGTLVRLESLLATRYIIIACEDSRVTSEEDDAEHSSFDLSSVYSILCRHLWKCTSVRQFCLISETMVLMLRTKNRSINQWNIDSTLGSIAIMCCGSAPSLRPERAGTIFQHLCQLLNTLLTTHRLKLEGHFHLVVQAMQALLRCFFTPLPHSASKVSKLFAPPPWLSSPKHQLNASLAASYTRLITLICDPSVSSVTRSKDNNLTSATDKAKRMAGQHMQFLLMLYVQLQLEMKMLPEVREKMIPGLYAIFDTTTPEMRRMIGDGLDSSGRSVFGTLFKDYQKFGKWKGS